MVNNENKIREISFYCNENWSVLGKLSREDLIKKLGEIFPELDTNIINIGLNYYVMGR